jgi:ubiquinone/menaquinone biosynthesis C-methylase UbiE
MKIKEREGLNYWIDLYNNNTKDYWMNHYFKLYCHYLDINKDSFEDKIIVDIGCGPHGALSLFNAKLRIGVDISVKSFNQLFDLKKHNIIYLDCSADSISMMDNFADVVISRNALDHVDDFSKSIVEIHRILKKGGEIVFSINLQHYPTLAEPQVLNKNIIEESFKNKFNYKIVKIFPKESNPYKHDILLIKGTKI